MSPELQWVIGTAIALLVLVGGVIARDRSLTNWFTDKVESVRAEADKEAKVLHERINRVRDEYSKRSDLDSYIAQMQTALQGLATEVRSHTTQTNTRLDALVNALIKKDV